jgi:mannose-6-phosphate isomerase-like protein (cupin superfamily)
MIMEMDEGSVHLKAGDVVIQLATNHNWRNPGTVDCVMAFVLIATEGAKTTGWSENNNDKTGH